MAHAINWFEIPVNDFNRAKIFYESILDTTLQAFEAMGMKSAFLPADLQNGSIGGCIIAGKGYEPAKTGTIVYLNGGDDLDIILSRVQPAGGTVKMPKTAIGPNGFMARFEDSEGNTIGLHSRQ